jgi:hypothetical protein
LGVLYREIFSASLQQELLTGIQAHYNTSKEYTGITFAWDHIQYQVKKKIIEILATQGFEKNKYVSQILL